MQRRELLQYLGAAALPWAVPPLATASTEHLRGVIDSIGRQLRAGAAVGYFDELQFQTVEHLVETILPRTDTPGAREAGVARFIEVVVAEWYGVEEREEFLEGLSHVHDRSRRLGARSFATLEASAQARAVAALELRASLAPSAMHGILRRVGLPLVARRARFYRRLKSLTLLGYYRSEVGSRHELGEVFMPGYYDGDVVLPGAEGPD